MHLSQKTGGISDLGDYLGCMLLLKSIPAPLLEGALALVFVIAVNATY